MTVKILAVRPVVFQEAFLEFANEAGMQDGVPNYDGSTVVQCVRCNTDCYLGPRQ